jgi:hypothetical protein
MLELSAQLLIGMGGARAAVEARSYFVIAESFYCNDTATVPHPPRFVMFFE